MTREEFRGALSDIDEGGRLSHSEEARKAEILLLDHDKEQRAEISQAHKTNEYLASQIRTWEKICSEQRAEIARLREALQGILEIGKRDMTNPKYDAYFEQAQQALKETT